MRCMSKSYLEKNTKEILEKCAEKNVKLCIATKTQSIEDIAMLPISPDIIFAENRVQEAEAKKEYYASVPNELHLIGPLQKNKVRKAVQLFDVIQTVDSWELLQKIDTVCAEEEKMVKVFLNINISKDPKKSGFLLDEITTIITRLKKSPNTYCVITGIFTILANNLSEKSIREYYVLMRRLFEVLQLHFGLQFSEISMGMSRDYPLAIEAGATMVRVGSGVFGKRVGEKKI